jgi:hypothetical protein
VIIIKYNSLTYEYVKDFIEVVSTSNCKLNTFKEDYKDTNTILEIQCSCGDKYKTSFKRFSSKQAPKQQCNKCGAYIRDKSKRLNYEQVKHFIEVKSNSGYKLLSKEYIKSSKRLKIQCDKGHIFEMNFNNFQKGKRCPDCYGNRKYVYEEVYNIFKECGCELLTKEYRNNKQKLEYVCSCGENAKINLSKFLAGQRCKSCMIERFLKSIQYDNFILCSCQQFYIYNLLDNSKLNYNCENKFLDIAFPNEKIYIEYDGSGHNLGVLKNEMSQSEFNLKEIKRYYIVKDAGWKMIRIISVKDKLPADKIILQMISEAKEYLNTGHSWIKFDIDNNKVINSQGEFDYDFGELRKIKKDDIIINERSIINK